MQIPQLTFTRFIASISIVILHFGLFSWPINSHWFAPFQMELVSAMSYFFVLSGFILVISSARNNTLANDINTKIFWKRRAARILPIYLLALFVFFCINFSYDPNIPLKWQIQSYYHSIFLLQSWKYKMALDVNYPAWSLSVEAFFYFIFPWLYGNVNKLTTKKLVWVSVLAWVLNLYVFISLKAENVPENFVKFFPLLHVATFLIGVCAAVIFIKHLSWFNEDKVRKSIWGLTLIASFVVLFGSYKNFDIFNYQHNGLLAPWFILIFYSLAIMKGRIATILSAKPLIFLGSISYSVYILQWPVMQICQKYIPVLKNMGKGEVFYPYIAILLIISSFTYLFIEKPARNFINQLGQNNAPNSK
jgi:peptidoglycan/LPS O-acetylase OafA/YrhL